MNSRFNCQQSFYNEYQNNVHPNHQQRQQNSNQQNNNVTKTNGVGGVESFHDSCWQAGQPQNELNSSSAGYILMKKYAFFMKKNTAK